MIGFFFGLHARLGRLQYFLSCVGFAVVAGIIAFGIISYATGLAAAGRSDADISIFILVPILVIAALLIWFGICLQSMRIRDMGLNPAIVIPTFFVVIAIDSYVAMTFPALAVAQGNAGTLVGAIANFAFNAALLFWPSSSYEPPSSSFTVAEQPRDRPPSPMAARTLPKPRPSPFARKGFGRLGQQ